MKRIDGGERGLGATGIAAVPGFAVGNALVVHIGAELRDETGTRDEELARVARAVAHAKREIGMLVASLPRVERALFEPELVLLDDLERRMMHVVRAGLGAEEAALAVTREAPSDLVIDARTRLLEALGGGGSALSRAIATRNEPELVLVTNALSPSMVAALPPQVSGIVASGGGYQSHAAILARSRELPLLYVDEPITDVIADGELVVLDTSAAEASLRICPNEAVAAELRDARAAREAAESAAAVSPDVDVGVDLRVNVASLHDRVPPEASGIGLVRTELLFAARTTPPSARDQTFAFIALARKAAGRPVVIRLFDAGADKPLAWLPARPGERGIELLFAHPDVLASQVEAVIAARRHADVRVLLPMTRSVDDVARVRSLLPSSVQVGAMIETISAARQAAEIARAADFVSIGTNDLSADILGVDRRDAPSSDPRVMDVVREIVCAAHAQGREVTVCGELAGDPDAALALASAGVDALSMAAGRLPVVRRALAR